MRRTLLLVLVLIIAGAFAPKPVDQIRSVTEMARMKISRPLTRSPASVGIGVDTAQSVATRLENSGPVMTDEDMQQRLERAWIGAESSEKMTEYRKRCQSQDGASCATLGRLIQNQCVNLKPEEAKTAPICLEAIEINLASCRQGYTWNCGLLLQAGRDRAELRAEVLKLNAAGCERGRKSSCQHYER